MKILYIGEPETAALYHSGDAPAHWLYGAAEMERAGHQVVWERERHALFHDIALLLRHRPDRIFIPNLNLANHRLLLLLKAIRLISTPVDAWLHHGRRQSGSRLTDGLTRLLLRGVDTLKFLSTKSMTETINARFVDARRCSAPEWKPDMAFYSRVDASPCSGRFVSTGKENRDFDTLLEAFRITGAPLTIMTAHRHATRCYDSLVEKCRDLPNVRLVITENTGAVYPVMVAEMASAKALVCPLLRDSLDYCVGLSTIADARGLAKPLIITANPYHDDIYLSPSTIQVTTVDDWVAAIKRLSPQQCANSVC